jgi:23S rRNA (uridine2552-2'-O)-methyltransferase
MPNLLKSISTLSSPLPLHRTLLRPFTKTSKTANWAKSHISNQYVKLAQKNNYRARSAYKLLEGNDQFNFLRPSTKVLELGSAPGGWTKVITQKIYNSPPIPPKKSNLIAVDLLEMAPVDGCHFIKGNFMGKEVHTEILRYFNHEKSNFSLLFIYFF